LQVAAAKQIKLAAGFGGNQDESSVLSVEEREGEYSYKSLAPTSVLLPASSCSS
jgi:hypothetical protein